MNKKVLEKLTRIRERIKLVMASPTGGAHFKKRFNHNTASLVMDRVGYRSGQPMSVAEVAKKYQVSESWVNKAQKQVEDYLFGKGTKTTKKVTKAVKKTVVGDKGKTDERFSTASRCIAVAKFNLKSGELNVECPNDIDKKVLYDGLSHIIDEVKGRSFAEARINIARDAHMLEAKAGRKSAMFWWMALVQILAIAAIWFVPMGSVLKGVAVVVQLIVGLIGLWFLFSEVSLKSERKGLLQARNY